MGKRSTHFDSGRSSCAHAILRRTVAMDGVGVSGLSRFRGGRRRSGRIQRQIYEQPNGAAWQLGGDTGRSCARDVPKFFPAGKALAIYWHPIGEVTCSINIHTFFGLRLGAAAR